MQMENYDHILIIQVWALMKCKENKNKTYLDGFFFSYFFCFGLSNIIYLVTEKLNSQGPVIKMAISLK